MTPSPKWDRTHTHIQLAALELFTHQGYSATTTAQIAAVAEVSQMTLFRHFPTKESLILQDPFDPAIAEAVEKRPAKEAPLRAIIAGIQSLLDTFTPDVEEQLRTGCASWPIIPNWQRQQSTAMMKRSPRSPRR